MRIIRDLMLCVCILLCIFTSCFAQTETKSVSVRVVLQVAPKTAKEWPVSKEKRLAILEKAKTVLLSRLRGIVECELIAIHGDSRLVMEFNGAIDSKNVTTLINKAISTDTIEFYYLKDVRRQNAPLAKWQMESSEDPKTYLFIGPKGIKIDSQKQPSEVMKRVVKPSSNPPILTGTDLLPNVEVGINMQQLVVINIEFNERGAQILKKFTRRHYGEILAIFYGGRLLAAPEIRCYITDGKAEVTGFSSLSEARQVADMLNSGVMPVAFKVISKEVLAQ